MRKMRAGFVHRFDEKFGMASAMLALFAASPAFAQAQASPSGTAEVPLTAPSAPVQDATAGTTTMADAPVAVEDSPASQDIVVTAQRRSESAQRVPISLTALSAEALTKANVTSVIDLPKVAPGFYIFRGPQAANTQLSIRGIGTSGNSALEPSVGAYVDGIYVPRPGPLLAGLNDIGSVEVLRGPQGTLFGRNASVGAISFHTVEPKQLTEAAVDLQAGNFGRMHGTGLINLPVTDSLATRFSMLYDSFDGYGSNQLGGRLGKNETLSFRGAAKARVSSVLTWLVRGDYQKQRGDGLAVSTVVTSTVTPTGAANWNRILNGLTPRLDDTYSFNVRQTTQGAFLHDDQWGVSSDLSLELGRYTVRLLSGYRDWDNRQYERDATRTAADLYGVRSSYRSKSHSEELQVVSPSDLLNDHLSFVGGLYYYRERYIIGQQNDLNPNYCNIFIRNARSAQLAACLANAQVAAVTGRFNQLTESYAAFGQATVKIVPIWEITGGLRYSSDDKDGTVTARLNNPAASLFGVTDNAALTYRRGRTTYRANTTLRPFRDVMFYATVSSGFKSGGFDSTFAALLGNNRVFEPETTTNYELGVKSELFGRRLTANATVFRMDIDNFQVRSFNGVAFSVRNAGSVRQQGVEFDLTARPVRSLTIGASGTFLDSQYTDFRNAPGLPGFGGTQNLTGARVPYSPKFQGTLSADYRTRLTDSLSLGLNARGSILSDINIGAAADNNPQGIQNGYRLLGARISLYGADDKWELAIAGDNLTDKRYCTVIFPQTQGGAFGLANTTTGGTTQRCVLGEPATVRASVKVRF